MNNHHKRTATRGVSAPGSVMELGFPLGSFDIETFDQESGNGEMVVLQFSYAETLKDAATKTLKKIRLVLPKSQAAPIASIILEAVGEK